jgi:hypothetical protein
MESIDENDKEKEQNLDFIWAVLQKKWLLR